MMHLVRYIRATPLPHATKCASILLGILFLDLGIEALLTNELAKAFCHAVAATLSFAVCFFAAADALSRYREYQRLRCAFARFGFHPRIANQVASSRCQRDAALLAASEVGVDAELRRYFHILGYRWFHILPATLIRTPTKFFSPRFLCRTFLPGKKSRPFSQP